MLKKVMAMALTGMVLCSATACAYATDIVETPVDQSVSQTASNSNPGIMPIGIIFNDNVSTNSGSYTSDKKTATSSDGKIIRVYYKNDEDQKRQAAHVALWKVGKSKPVLSFDVAYGSQRFEEYSALFSNSGTYYVKITPVNGTALKGYVAFVQTSTSLKS